MWVTLVSLLLRSGVWHIMYRTIYDDTHLGRLRADSGLWKTMKMAILLIDCMFIMLKKCIVEKQLNQLNFLPVTDGAHLRSTSDTYLQCNGLIFKKKLKTQTQREQLIPKTRNHFIYCTVFHPQCACICFKPLRIFTHLGLGKILLRKKKTWRNWNWQWKIKNINKY